MQAPIPTLRAALAPLALLGSAFLLSAAPQNVLVLGDSLSEEYAFELPFSAPNTAPLQANIANWVEILSATRDTEISFGNYEGHLAYYADYRNGGHAFNWAVPGFRTTDLVELLNPPVFPSTAEQLLDAVSFPKLKAQLRDGSVAWAVIFCSGNDLSALYSDLCTGVATTADLAAIRDNLATTVDFVRAQDAAVKIVLVSAPDIGVTPSVKTRVPDAALRAIATDRIAALNTLIEELATARSIAFANIFSITRTLDGEVPFLIGGIPFHKTGDPENRPQFLFAKDGFHASTAAQALIANAILQAMNTRYGAGFTLLENPEILGTVLGLPTITTQTRSVGVVAGQSACLRIDGTEGSSHQWFKGEKSVFGACGPALDLPNVGPAEAGLYDCAVSKNASDILSAPVVVGIVPPAGTRTAGDVATRDEWQDIQHPVSGYIYDQFLLTGAAGTFTADTGQIARCSFLDPNDSIVQVEMSGAGAITIVLEPTTVAGPMAPALYNQSGILYMKGKATIVLAGADATTHFTIYSVGTATNPGVTRSDAAYAGWANIAAAGIISTDGKLGGIHQGNVSYSSSIGYTGLYAPDVTRLGSLAVIHSIEASGAALPYLYFGAGGTAPIKIAGTSLAQPNGDIITVRGLAQVSMGAGQDSCGRGAPAAGIQTRLVEDSGTDVTAAVVTGP